MFSRASFIQEPFRRIVDDKKDNDITENEFSETFGEENKQEVECVALQVFLVILVHD